MELYRHLFPFQTSEGLTSVFSLLGFLLFYYNSSLAINQTAFSHCFSLQVYQVY